MEQENPPAGPSRKLVLVVFGMIAAVAAAGVAVWAASGPPDEDLTHYTGTPGWYEAKAGACTGAAGKLGSGFKVHLGTELESSAPAQDARATSVSCRGYVDGPKSTVWFVELHANVGTAPDTGTAAGCGISRTALGGPDPAAPDPRASAAGGEFKLLGAQGYRVHRWERDADIGPFQRYRYGVAFCDGNLTLDANIALDQGKVPEHADELVQYPLHRLARTVRDRLRVSDLAEHR